MMGDARRRHGVTPVLAIMLLLMMTVALAGAAFTWFGDVRSGLIDRGDDFESRFAVVQKECRADPGGVNNVVELSLQNTGQEDVAGTQVSLFLDDGEGELNVTVTEMDWSRYNFTRAGGFDSVTVNLTAAAAETHSDFLRPASFYTIRLEFADAGVSVEAGSCVAQ